MCIRDSDRLFPIASRSGVCTKEKTKQQKLKKIFALSIQDFSFSDKISFVILGSAFPLDNFMTSPTNKPINPFFPFLNSFTFSGNLFNTWSIKFSILLTFESSDQ